MGDAFKFELAGIKTALVIGAGHGIGLSLVRALLVKCPNAHVFATWRDEDKAGPLRNLQAVSGSKITSVRTDPADEAEVEGCCQFLSARTKHLDLVINCVGTLHNGQEFQPEKSLAQINASQLLTSFKVNSIGTVLWAKHLLPLMRNSTPSVFACLSARVGSIGDNRLGGWYGYRASKAALNMFVRNIAIEYDRNKCHTLVLALHPGTTRTDLSAPFLAGSKYQLHTADETANNLLHVIENAGSANHGGFLDWRGDRVEW